MALFKAGEAVPGHPFIPRELILEESWGEIWRARSALGASILVVGYTTPEGDTIFEESLQALRKWKEVAEQVPTLLKIIEISESAIPYLIVEDPEGGTWREAVMESQEPLPLEDQAAMASMILDAIAHGEASGLAPLGVTPDSIFHAVRSPNIWRLIPIAPKSPHAVTHLAQGRYFPREITVAEKPGEIHADCYSLAWIWSEGMRRDFTSPWPEPTEAILYPKLSLILESTLAPKAGFSNDPNILLKNIATWTSADLQSDREAFAKRLKEMSQSAFMRLFNKKKGILGRFFVTLLVVGGLLGGIATVAAARIGGGGGGATWDDEQLAREYFAALSANNTDKTQEFCDDEALEQTGQAARLIADMKAKGLISNFQRTDSRIIGKGETRVAEGILFDQDNKPFATMRLKLQQEEGFLWSVVDAYFTQTRFK
ncbi:hypothetical protein IT571_10515 [Candidatus Sumerlaeota bacterium]|nr:hypothetical protein [Candidatus Sumerlaeota bacterium]